MSRNLIASLRRALLGVAVLVGSLVSAPHAQDWGAAAMISSTMGVQENRLCVGESSRGDIGCPTYAPYISPTSGAMTLTAGLTVDAISLTTVSTTWGYLRSAGSYIPYLSTNNISATTINGQPISSFGASSTVISGTTSMVSGWPDAIVCNFTTPAWGIRIIPLSYAPWATNGRYIYRVNDAAGAAGSFAGIVFNADGSFSDNNYYNGSQGDQPSASSCSSKSISQLYAEGKAFNFIGNSGLGGGLGDRLTSGTLNVTANSDTSIISLTTVSTTWGYLSAAGSYLPKLNTGTISTTALQISGTATTCTTANAGTLRYSSATTALELCTGTGWQTMGVGIPAGTISAFASTTCPTGWSEYTPARGRFLRGIDNAAGNDPSGTRAPGNIQSDQIGSHYHAIPTQLNGAAGSNGSALSGNANGGYQSATGNVGGAETRPRNVAVTYCQFNGTSNGWNNPISGGSTVPGGSSGEIQFNSAGAFAGTAGLVWDNASSTLLTPNISTSLLRTVDLATNNISVTTINGQPLSSFGGSGGSSSPTSVFRAGWPDAILCSGTIGSMYIYASYDNAADGRVIYRSTVDDYYVFYTSTGAFSSYGSPNPYLTSCNNKSIAQHVAAGNVYYFTGGGGAGSGYGLTSGTLGLTLNSPTSIISLTTASTTWGYLGATGSYLPNLSSNGISATNVTLTTINGQPLSALAGAASPTNVPAFRVSMSVDQTLATSTPTKLNFNTKFFDTYSSFNTSNSRFVPTISGYYWIVLTINCNTVTGSQACQAMIFKNGAPFSANITRAGGGNVTATATSLVYMNGTTDYVEGHGYSEATTATISAGNTIMSGALVASGNGLTSGTGAGVSALSSLTDVTLTGLVSNSVLVYDGTKWVNKFVQDTISTSTMVATFPDAIVCKNGAVNRYMIMSARSSGNYYYQGDDSAGNNFTAWYNETTGAYVSHVGLAGYDCVTSTLSISQLYAQGQAFNFIGGSGSGGNNSYGLTSGTLGLTLNSPTSIISLSTGATTWGYLGSNGSYLPNLSTNNISVSTINGVSVSSLGGGASPTNVPAFSAYSVTTQTVAANSWVKLNLVNEEFDSYNNYNTSTSRFTPTIAGYYMIAGRVHCSTATSCYSGIYKNGTNISQGGAADASSIVASSQAVVYLNGSSDYIELYGYTNGTQIIGFGSSPTHVTLQGTLVASGNGLISGSGAGVSAMASLTDVTLASLTSNSMLVYDGTKWVNKRIQDTISTTTMFAGIPDAISCLRTDGSRNVFSMINPDVSGNVLYSLAANDMTLWTIAFNRSTGAYSSNSGQSNLTTTISSAAGGCLNPATTLSSLYAAGNAFNFIGGAGSGGTNGYGLTSGTLGLTLNSPTSIISLSTGGTTWGYFGPNASYLPYLNSYNLSATNISVSTINGVSVSALGGAASPTNVPAFRAHRNGVSQAVTVNVATKLLFTHEDFDTYNNFDTTTSRFTPTIAGYYTFNATVYCGSASTICYTYIYKNGSIASQGGSGGLSDPVANTSTILYMNGTTDYVDAQVYSNTTPITGNPYNTFFSGSLLASGNGLTSGTGAGVSAMASLTDVTLSSLASNSMLVYDGTKWVNKLIQNTISTTSMVASWPDGIICTMGGSADTRVFALTFAPAVADGRYYYRSIEQGTNAYTQIGFNADASFYQMTTNAGYTTAGTCASKSISTLYTEGRAFNYIGGAGAGGGANGYGLTSGTLAVTLNSPTSIISLSTGATTWGYLGSAATYLPNLSTNNISATTINGVSISALGGSASPTNVPSFRVNKNGVNQTVAASTQTKITFSAKDFDTFNNFDTGTNRFTPTVAGNYIFTANAYCTIAATSCFVSILKNGVFINQSGAASITDMVAQTTTIIPMNGTTDYVEVNVYMIGSTTLNGASQYTSFSGSLLASGNGTISGTSAGVSAMASLTDVTLSSLTSNSMLVYDGTKWVNKFIQDTISTTTMVNGWPDALVCTDTGGSPAPTGRQVIFWQNYREGTSMSYKWGVDTTTYTINFNASGAYSGKYQGGGESDTSDCEGKSITQLYAEGKAFNFIGGSGSTNGGFSLISGTLGLTLNSPTSIISLTSGATTWGYLGATGSYLPNLSSNGISTTNVTLTTINGQPLNSFAGAASPTNVPAFRAHHNGVAQTVGNGVWTKLNFSTKDFDNLSNYSTSTSRFMPQVAGTYIFNGNLSCSGTNCQVGVYKNGTMMSESGFVGQGYPHTSLIIQMNGTTDYVELWGYSAGSTSIPGSSFFTYFSGSLLASGNGSISGSTAGVSAMASLTDVTLTGLTSNSMLVYDGTKWVNKFIQDTISTSTIVAGWPDALYCTGASGSLTLTHAYVDGSNQHMYRLNGGDAANQIIFNSAGNYVSAAQSGTFLTNCLSKSISTLYAEGKAFNFIGGTNANGVSDKIVSGTAALSAINNTALVATTSLTVTGRVSATTLQLQNNPADVCNAASYGTFKMVNGRAFLCQSR